ncbi:hypothetical protein H920_04492 [Fukomys damarensis]|uniref:Uncharacterized protein n=1 Tax=Fukomys damarensis TaxID=885580 RepID=A0A091EFM0_FUKDA|nr:hypothetical protein H920_04492 [Fukomys damarensis]
MMDAISWHNQLLLDTQGQVYQVVVSATTGRHLRMSAYAAHHGSTLPGILLSELLRSEGLAQHPCSLSLSLSDSSGVALLFSPTERKRPSGPVREEGWSVLRLTLLHPVPIELEVKAVYEAPHRSQHTGVPQQRILGQQPHKCSKKGRCRFCRAVRRSSGSTCSGLEIRPLTASERSSHVGEMNWARTSVITRYIRIWPRRQNAGEPSKSVNRITPLDHRSSYLP